MQVTLGMFIDHAANTTRPPLQFLEPPVCADHAFVYSMRECLQAVAWPTLLQRPGAICTLVLRRERIVACADMGHSIVGVSTGCPGL
jgi:hypothetical protein